MPVITKAKLKAITLEVKQIEEYRWEYTAFDENGKRLTSRIECRAGNGQTYICALITKNRNHKYAYSMKNLFTSMARIKLASKDSPAKNNCRPYAIAIIPEIKQAYGQWIEVS